MAVVPKPVVPPPPRFEEMVLDSLEKIEKGLAEIKAQLEPHEDYYYEEDTVVHGSAKNIYVLTKRLYRYGRWGYIRSDDGTIKVKINKKYTITLKRGEELDLRGFKVEHIRISTTSTTALNYRLCVV